MTTEQQLRRGYEDDGLSEREIEANLDRYEAANPDDDEPDDDSHGPTCAMRFVSAAECTCGKSDRDAEAEAQHGGA